MKVKVIRPFRDKNTGSILREGLIIDVAKERFSELAGPRGVFVEIVEEAEESREESKEESREEQKGEIREEAEEELQEEKPPEKEKPADNKKTKNK